MEPSDELIHALRREEIEDARRLSIERKLELGGELFDNACQISLMGIRAQNPGITDDQALEMLRHRLELGRRLQSLHLEPGS